jgi:hypothetical protein
VARRRRFIRQEHAPAAPRMIHYTDCLTRLIHDIVDRVDAFSFLDPAQLLVFARPGRSEAAGAFATCHCLNLPNSEPGYYYWRNRQTGTITRRTQPFVTKTPEVWMGRRRLDYLISFALPRFCDQVLDGSRKAVLYDHDEPWLAKLDTVVHELYHIAPDQQGLRRFAEAADEPWSGRHGPRFLDDVAGLVRGYLSRHPDPHRYEFLRFGFSELEAMFGGVAGTTFRNFPSYPQRYREAVPSDAAVEGEVIPVRRSAQPVRYDERDLRVRAFTASGSRPVHRSELVTAA